MSADPPSLDLLLREHSDFVDRLARRLLADPDAAEDLRQDAWSAVLEARPRSIGDFRAWIAGLVRNLARVHRRRERARLAREHAAAVAEDGAAGAATVAAQLDEFERLLAAVRRLREPFRSAIVMRYHEGLQPRAIARRTGVSIETVKSRQKRALAMLRADLRSSRGGSDRAWRAGLAALLVRSPARWSRTTIAAALAAALLPILALSWPWSAAPPPAIARVSVAATAPRPGPPAPDAAADERRNGGRSEVAGTVTVSSSLRSLRVVDARTGEPVPEFVLAAPSLRRPLLVTDAEGRVHFGDDASGDVELRLIDDPRLRRDRPIAGEERDGELRVAVGPTWRLVLDPPPLDRERFEACLTAADARLGHRTSFAPLRGGAAPWVRFGADALELDGGPPWRLEIRSDDGFRFGSVTLGSGDADRLGVVRVELEARGRVHGTVEQRNGAPIDQAEIVLQGAAAANAFAGVTDEEGRFDLPWIPPGRYTLRARSRLHEPAETVVVVDAASATEATLRLAPAPGREIEGRLVSEAGIGGAGVPGHVVVVLTHREDPELTFLRTIQCDVAPAGGCLATFHFTALPPGTYDLQVRAPDFVRWQPARSIVTPGTTGIVLMRRDATPCGDLTLRAIDAGTGAPVERFDAFVRLDGDDDTAKVLAAADGRAVLENVPLDAGVEWVVRAPGMVPQRGDRGAMISPVRLEPGWGNELRCTDREGDPVAGIALAVEGVVCATTDARGRANLRAAAAPERLAIASPGWRIVAGDVRSDGTWRDLIWGFAIVVEPTVAEPTKPTAEAPK